MLFVIVDGVVIDSGLGQNVIVWMIVITTPLTMLAMQNIMMLAILILMDGMILIGIEVY